MTPEVAVIPAAGLGTRLLPATRVVPKALVTVVDRPAVQWAVEEAARAGAQEVVLVVDSVNAALVQAHFDGAEPLPGLGDVAVTTVVQKTPRGLGDAVATARQMVGDRSFFCVLADNMPVPGGDVLAGLASALDRGSAVSVREVDDETLGSYGVVDVEGEVAPGVLSMRGAVEKPGSEAAPSRFGLIGRYLFSPEVFGVLEGLEPGYGGEIQLTDAIDRLGAAGRCVAVVADDDLLDVGSPQGLVRATMVLGMAYLEDS